MGWPRQKRLVRGELVQRESERGGIGGGRRKGRTVYVVLEMAGEEGGGENNDRAWHKAAQGGSCQVLAELYGWGKV